MKQIYLINEEGIYLDTVLLKEDGTFFNGEVWSNIQLNYVEQIPPYCKKCKWDGSKWIVLEEYVKEENIKEPTPQDKLNANLIKQNAQLLTEINAQKQLNSQVLLELAKLKGGNANV